MRLPFLVVYGAVVWKVLVGVAAIVGPLAWRWLRVLRRRRAARRNVKWASAAETALTAGPVTLVGTLHGGEARSVDHGRARHDLRDDELWVDWQGTRVDLVGSLHVEEGTHVRTAWWQPRRILPSDIAARRLRSTMVRSVGDGDQVLVSGVAEEVAESSSYRETLTSWRLHAGGGMKAIAVSAMTPDEQLAPRGPLRWLGAAALSGALVYAVLTVLGSMLLDNVNFPLRDDHTRWTADEIDWFWALPFAAATPRNRDDALKKLDLAINGSFAFDDGLDGGMELSDEQVEMSAALAELRGDCASLAYDRAGRLEAALDADFRCGNFAGVALHAAALGRYEEAWAAQVVTGNYTRDVAIATGHWDEALTDSLTGRCTSALLRRFAGERAPFGEHCDIEPIFTTSSAQWADAVSTVLSGVNWQSAYFSASGNAADWSTLLGLPEFVLYPNGPRSLINGNDVTFWLARHIGPARDGAASANHALRAAAAIVQGDLPGARAELAQVTALPNVHDYLASEVALRDGSALPEAPHQSVQAWVAALRNGRRIVVEPGMDSPPDELAQAVLHGFGTAATTNDAAELARVLRRGFLVKKYGSVWTTYDPLFEQLVLAVLPRVVRHRDQLLAVLRVLGLRQLTSAPESWASVAAFRRDIARLGGDLEEAQRWQAIVDRQIQVLDDPRKVVALEGDIW